MSALGPERTGMDPSPTALFDSYESDFQQIVSSIRDKLANDANAGGESGKAALRRVEMELDEADEMVSQMEIEIQGIPQSIRPSYQTRVRTSKQTLATLKKQAKDAHVSLGRSELIGSRGGGPTSDDPYAPTSDRSRLLAGTSLLEDGSRRLQESQRIALETEETGADILRNLRIQREQIENSRNTLQAADSSIDRASGTLKKMIRRMYQQRFITAGIIAVLIILICIIVYEKVFA
ncbi:V-snare-domain-containing protein [Punctularia strigosozonata HHB-11173 SS5]|uniref:V-snare-domain-containing protein n=1 Tax=Punctularia strigosozonata (strain HHB-11173) TaxID=741275 RepID=UPI0004416DD3|nr:V-snare-domain-containing protein [Punctularia strigosozonata HHB-11173 SS5]EIN08659.1 V-snare-domain-containing protein [Punctularia strigosozonata HHB-11173 SS5]